MDSGAQDNKTVGWKWPNSWIYFLFISHDCVCFLAQIAIILVTLINCVLEELTAFLRPWNNYSAL